MDFDNRQYKAQRLRHFEGLGVSDAVFNLTIGLVLLWGFFVNGCMAVFFSSSILQMNYLLILVLYFAGSIVGTMTVYKSDQPLISLVGFTLLSMSMGLLLTYFVSYYTVSSISTAFFLSGVVTACMIVLSCIFPAFFNGLGRTLATSLLLAIIADLAAVFLFRAALGILDMAVVLIFCGYIGYDWSKAQMYPRTLDNAIDCAADIYVDIVNLFIRILSLLGRRRSD